VWIEAIYTFLPIDDHKTHAEEAKEDRGGECFEFSLSEFGEIDAAYRLSILGVVY
jgi:hypothetical protein